MRAKRVVNDIDDRFDFSATRISGGERGGPMRIIVRVHSLPVLPDLAHYIRLPIKEAKLMKNMTSFIV